MIKILLPLQHKELTYEGVWVKEFSPNRGEINNLPVYTKEYKFADIIEFDPETSRAVGVVQDGGYTAAEIIRYHGKFEDEKAKWEAKGYVIEGMGRGKLAIASKSTEQEIGAIK
jgi:hypothetical protein